MIHRVFKNGAWALLFLSIFLMGACQEQQKQQTAIDRIIESKTIRIGVDPGFQPFEMKDKHGALMGFDIDIANMLADSMNVHAEFVYPENGFVTILDDLNAGKFDVILSGMTITPERNMKVMFSDPYIIVGQAALVHPKHKENVSSYEDLNMTQYIVGFVNGTTGQDAVKRLMPDSRLAPLDSEHDGVKQLFSGQIDALVFDLPFCSTQVAQHGEDKFLFLSDPMTFEPLAMAVRYDDYQMHNFLNNFILQIQSDGRYDELYDRWFQQTKWFKRL